ncbi:50S ribosomal protein L10 [uncultured Desulfobacterium sp.]|uniref:Large ribosomal subunit protein uL10 n=1 Tax=uncultured Desulfobacterium sp. TaxID=201089 RepID=A0A445MS90_9BACT|nr:50S ribosomal protein L10 [uncultured Desulfobacterium sp.]
MNKEQKEQLITDLHARLEIARGTFLVHYQGLQVGDLNRLRNDLRNTGAELQVVKNRLLKIASRGTGNESLNDHMKGPSAVTILHDDIIGPAKALVDFAKDFGQLVITSGQISGKEISAEDVRQLAKLPGREVLLAQVLSAMQAVPAGFVRVLGGILSKLLYVLKAIEQQKQEAGA